MFGEKDIIGFKESKIDDKNRFILPKFTYATYGDKLAYSSDEDSRLVLSNLTSLKARIESLKNSVGENNTEIMLIDHKLEVLYSSIITTISVDRQGRALIPHDVWYLYHLSDQVYMQGLGTRLKLFPSLDDYNAYRENLKCLKK